MKTVLWLLFAAACIAHAADTNYTASQALDKFKGFTLADGASYYRFSQNGTFESGPLGLSGRTLHGTWKTSDGVRFTVIAETGWINGASPTGDYRRIVFHISHLRKQPPKAQPPGWFTVKPEDLFAGYYFIDEFVKSEKPSPAEPARK